MKGVAAAWLPPQWGDAIVPSYHCLSPQSQHQTHLREAWGGQVSAPRPPPKPRLCQEAPAHQTQRVGSGGIEGGFPGLCLRGEDQRHSRGHQSKPPLRHSFSYSPIIFKKIKQHTHEALKIPVEDPKKMHFKELPPRSVM